MEVGMEVSSLCVIATVAAVFLTWLVNIITPFSTRRSKLAKKVLPPGPWTLPVIGSLHHVINAVPHRAFAELSRRYGPLMLLQLGEIPTVVVSSADVAALIMKTHDLVFANRAHSVTLDIFSSGGIGFGFSPYGDRWRNLRKACVAGLLSAKQVKRHEGIRAEEVGKLLRSITTAARDGAVVNLSHKFSALTTSITSRAMFSDRCSQKQQDAFIDAMDKVVRVLGGFALVDVFPSSRLVRRFSNSEREMKKSIGHIQDLISEIIRDRKAADTDNEDVLEALLRFREEDTPLPVESLGAVILELFTGGTETSATVLGWAMSELFNSPKIMAKVQSEVRQVLGPNQGVISNTELGQLPFMQMVIKEALRTHPPAPLLIPRETREDITIMGYDIPKGTTISVNAFAISRDPRFWEDPDEFKPERFENSDVDYHGTHFQFTPFGAGRRQCPGILFGESVIQIALANLLYHFDWLHPSGVGADRSVDMSEINGLSGGRRFDLELIATPHVFTSTVA